MLFDGLVVFVMWLFFWSWGYLAGQRAARVEHKEQRNLTKRAADGAVLSPEEKARIKNYIDENNW